MSLNVLQFVLQSFIELVVKDGEREAGLVEGQKRSWSDLEIGRSWIVCNIQRVTGSSELTTPEGAWRG